MLVNVVRFGLIILVKLLVGAQARWVTSAPSLTDKSAPNLTSKSAQRIYFTNHSSHLDTLALWTALPAEIRAKTRPVAAKDYWGNGRIKRFIALKVLNCVLIDREQLRDPLAPLIAALAAGDSLIIFPEGTRRSQAEPSDFKGGLYHLAEAFPNVQLMPVYLDTLHRSMPKGSILPVPLICTVRFGDVIYLETNERKKAFLSRARDAVIALI